MIKKRVIITGAILAVVVIGFTACEKAEDLNANDIEGVYEGTFSVASSLKAASPEASNQGTAEISLMGDNQIEVHCFGEDIDTIFMLDYYEHFGGFDMHKMTFTYSIKMMEESSLYYLRFQGIKQ